MQENKFLSVVALTNHTIPTFHVLTETGPSYAAALRHYTTSLGTDDLLTEQSRTTMARDKFKHFPYHIIASPPVTESKAKE